MRRFTIVLLCVGFVATATILPSKTLAADNMKNLEDSSPQEIVDGMATKGVRGGINILTGWLEFPKQIYGTTKEAGWAKGLIVGPFKGIGMTIVRTVSGAGELATFYLAYPGFYDPWFEPRFAWQPE